MDVKWRKNTLQSRIPKEGIGSPVAINGGKEDPELTFNSQTCPVENLCH